MRRERKSGRKQKDEKKRRNEDIGGEKIAS